jgi:AraC family transcriptional regulator
MRVEIRELSALRIAAVRHIGPYHEIGKAFERLGEIAAAARLFGPDATMIGIYHDDPGSTPAAELRSDAGITVPADATLPAGVTEQWIPKGRYACAVHHGPYEALPQAWHQLMSEWLPESGQRLGGGPSFELYRNTPDEVPADELRTELCVPLA